jgi:hypothetical protein
MEAQTHPTRGQIEIFRAADAGELLETMRIAPMDAEQMQGLTRLVEADYSSGFVVKVLFSSEALGVSLTYSWFKPGFPLPRHCHDADCLYYIISGELTYGAETLLAGDSMLVPAGALYTFETGEGGVEFVEFRQAASYDIDYRSSPKAWARQLEQTRARAPSWQAAEPPLAARRMTAAN